VFDMSRPYLEYYSFERFKTSARPTILSVASESASYTVTANVLTAIPFISPVTCRIGTVNVNVATAATGSLRVGLYRDSGSISPGGLVYDFGAVDTGSTGEKNISPTNAFLYRDNLYWISFLPNAAPAITGHVDAYGDILGSSAVAGQPYFAITTGYTYGALPNPFPSPQTIAYSSNIIRLTLLANKLSKKRPYMEDVYFTDYRKSGRYFHGTAISRSTANYAINGGTIAFCPFIVTKSEKFDQIGINVNTAGSGNARLGVYKAAEKSKDPRGLIIDAGEVSIASTGVKTISTTIKLNKGLYYLVVFPSSNVTLSSVSYGSYVNFLGCDSGFTGLYTIPTLAYTYGSLPSLITSPPTTFYSQIGPLVALRKA